MLAVAWKSTALAVRSAPESAYGQRGESPLQVDALRPVTERNCIDARRCGKQLKVNCPSVG